MEDLAGIGKIAEVILQSVGKAIGSVLEPWQTRRVGKAKADVEAYALQKKAEAQWRADVIRSEQLDAPDEVAKRAGLRIVTVETNNQQALEMIVLDGVARSQKREAEGARSRPLDDDWIRTFIDYASKVSHEQLRGIWAEILASQATDGAPSASKATLDAIRLIEPGQAAMFMRAVHLHMAMGQIIDVDPIEGHDVAYFTHMPDATALEDLNLLKRVRDLETSLDVNGGLLTFWRDVQPGSNVDQYLPWYDPEVRGHFLELVTGVARGTRRDHGRVRETKRIDRQILTTRGFELAAILVPTFNDVVIGSAPPEPQSMGDFGRLDVQDEILKQWARRISGQAAAVIFAHPVHGAHLRAGAGTYVTFDPKAIFDPLEDDWMEIETGASHAASASVRPA